MKHFLIFTAFSDLASDLRTPQNVKGLETLRAYGLIVFLMTIAL